jgi:1-acyl-sn-glycerol-3-phosphate acyltransferase
LIQEITINGCNVTSTSINQFTDKAITRAMRLIAKALSAGRLQTSASGLEHIPVQGPALVVARHYHHLFDGLALFTALRRPFHIVVTLDWVQSLPSKFFMQTLTSLARWPVVLRRDALFRSSRSVPGKGAALFSLEDVIHYQRRGLHQAVELLVEGRLLVVFPEGYPNIDPTYTLKTNLDGFLPFKSGFVNIVRTAETRLKGEIPIIPAGFCYTAGRPWIAHLRFGEAIYRAKFDAATKLVERLESDVKLLSRAISGI